MLHTVRRPALLRPLLVLAVAAVAFGGGVALHEPPLGPRDGGQELIELIASQLTIGPEQALHATIVSREPDTGTRRTEAYFLFDRDGRVYYSLHLSYDIDGNPIETQIAGSLNSNPAPRLVEVQSSDGWSFHTRPDTLDGVIRSLAGNALEVAFPNEGELPPRAVEGLLRNASWGVNDGEPPRFEERTLFRADDGARLLRERIATYRVISIDEVPEARIGG